MSDNTSIFCRIFIFFKEFLSARKSHLIDILFNFLTRHPDSLVFDGQRFCILINLHLDDWVPVFNLRFTNCCQVFQLRCRIRRVRNQLTQKNLVVAVKKLFNQRKNILHRYINTSCCHIYIIFCFKFLKVKSQKKDHPKINDKLSLDRNHKSFHKENYNKI